MASAGLYFSAEVICCTSTLPLQPVSGGLVLRMYSRKMDTSGDHQSMGALFAGDFHRWVLFCFLVLKHLLLLGLIS